MKTYTLSFAQSIEHKPDHPERTARRSIGYDVTYQVWPSRAAMLKTIEMQGRSAHSNRHWRAVKWVCEKCNQEHSIGGVLIVACPEMHFPAIGEDVRDA